MRTFMTESCRYIQIYVLVRESHIHTHTHTYIYIYIYIYIYANVHLYERIRRYMQIPVFKGKLRKNMRMYISKTE